MPYYALLTKNKSLIRKKIIVYMSIESVNRKVPWLFKTPSIPFGARANGSVEGLASGESEDLSITSASP